MAARTPPPRRRKAGTLASVPEPASGYTWEQFSAGHTKSVQHGATSPRLVSERAESVLAEMMTDFPWLASCDAVLVDVLIKAKTRHIMLSEWTEKVITGEVEAHARRGRPRTGIEAIPDQVWRALEGAERSVTNAASRLGMSPVDRASLFKDSAVARRLGTEAVAALSAEGRRIRQLREGGA